MAKETAERESNPDVKPAKPRNARRLLLLGGGAAALLAFGFLQRRWWIMNDITTGETPEYPDLPSRVYAADAVTARQAAEAACAALPRWRLVTSPGAEAASPIHVEVVTALFNFTDDVTVRFEPVSRAIGTASARTRVVIRSHSRVGKGDLGENERHIRALQREVDARLPRVAP